MESEKKGNKGLSFVSQNITFVLYVQHFSCDKLNENCLWNMKSTRELYLNANLVHDSSSQLESTS